MDKWRSELDGSSFKANLASFLARLDGVDATQATDVQKAYLHRATAVAKFAESVLDSVDAELVSMPAVNELGSLFANADSSLLQWINSGNDTFLGEGYLNGYLNGVLRSLTGITPAVTPKSATSVVASLRRSVAQHRNSVDRMITELENKKLAISDKLAEKVDTTQESIDALTDATDKLKEKVQGISDEGDKALAAQSTSFRKMLSESEEQFKERVNDIKVGVEADFAAINKSRTDAEKLLEIVSEDVMVGDYSKNAKENRGRADRWMALTTVLMLLAISVGIMFVSDVSKETPWQKIVMKVVLVSAISGSAAYTARQGTEHRRSQRSAEEMALQLRAVKPYLEGVDGELRNQVLVTVADKMFGRSLEAQCPEGNEQSEIVTASQLVKVLVAFIEKSK